MATELSEKQIPTSCAFVERALTTGKRVASKNMVRNITLAQHLIH